jgi:N-acetylmuramoyl-L-alanine amidase
MTFQQYIAACSLALLLLIPAISHANTSVSAVRNAQHPSYHRIVFALSKPTDYKIFVLQQPSRLVIDLANTSIPPQIKFKPSGITQDFRFGLFRDHITRVVVDLNTNAKILKIQNIPSSSSQPYRLVIDFTRGTAQSPRQKSQQSAGWEQILSQFSPQLNTPAPTPSSIPVIVIDPGHGGLDPGASGKFYKSKEKHIVLDVSKKIAQNLKTLKKYRIVLTRTHDVFVKLRNRMRIAEKNHADLFVSIHADSFTKSSVRGMSVYALSNKGSDAEARLIAEQENRSDLIAGADLNTFDDSITGILIDLQQNETKIESVQFSEFLIRNMKTVTNLKRDTLRFASFAVLKSPTVPSLLIELGYLSNKYEEGLLRKSQYRSKLAKAISTAIHRYFQNRASLLNS